ncbi:MAG: cupredoxin domain-containing protein [Solirubrobacterales bacterium]
MALQLGRFGRLQRAKHVGGQVLAPIESGSIDTGEAATITLEKPGTFAYYCAFHPFMKGTITVE